MRKKLTKKRIEELKQKDLELIKKCISLSPLAMKEIDRLKELVYILADISALDTYHPNGENSLLDFIHTAYFDNSLLNPYFSDELLWPDGKGGWTTTEKELKIARRNAMRGCVEINKLLPLQLFTHPFGNKNENIDIVNTALLDIQNKLLPMCELYFRLKAELHGQTKERKRQRTAFKTEIKQILDKDRIVLLVNKLKAIGYSEYKACVIISRLLEFSKYPERLTWQAIQNRCKRA